MSELLAAPAEGIPSVIENAADLASAIDQLAAGHGPVAVDAERASGYRYGSRAYLIQIRRAGTGTLLIDPIKFADLKNVAAVIADEEWIIHAASQDLPSLREVGMIPKRLFDTELGGRLAGLPRVALGTLTESLLGISLAKEHSAVDWSKRPLPQEWLGYAALDVELLVDLRHAVASLLEKQGKLPWAEEEFAALLNAPPAPPRQDPWRRVSGLHQVKSRRSLAVVRELWHKRDEVAARRDIAPGRMLPDTAIVTAALALPKSEAELTTLPYFKGERTRQFASRWYRSIAAAMALPENELPPHKLIGDGPPPPKSWADKNPAAYARLSHAKHAVASVAEKNAVPVENMITPDTLRRLCWQPPTTSTSHHEKEAIRTWLQDRGVRNWQIELLLDRLTDAMTKDQPLPEIALVNPSEDLVRAVVDGQPLSIDRAADWPQPDTVIAFTLASSIDDLFLITSDGMVIGECGVKGGVDDQGRVEIGYGLAPSHHGQGFGTSAVRLLVQAVAGLPDVREIWAEVEPHNHPSQKILRRLGFQERGRTFHFPIGQEGQPLAAPVTDG
jgi:ribonuclease D